MGACSTLVRVVLIVFNILFLLAGLFLLGFGVTLKTVPMKLFSFFTDVLKVDDASQLENGLGSTTDAISIYMIVLGAVIAVIALLGIVAAATMKKFLLIPYVIIVILILAAEIALVVIVVIMPATIQSKILTDFKIHDSVFIKKIDLNYETERPTNSIGFFWYLIQNSFSCCGLRDDSKFEGIKKEVSVKNGVIAFNLTVPSSCCMQNLQTPLPIWNTTKVLKNFDKCRKGNEEFYNKQGCLDAFLFNANKIPLIIAGITLGIELILIICTIIALCMPSKTSV